MSIYRAGACSVTSGSNVVTGTSTAFLANVAVGDSFKFIGENAIYSVISVDYDNQLKISPNYAGATKTTQLYQIMALGSRTTNLGLAEMTGDLQDWPFWMTNEVIRKIDASFSITGAAGGNWYEQSSFTATATVGLTTTPAATWKYTRVGNTVTLDVAAISGTSNSATFTIAGVPTTIRPASQKTVLCRAKDNGGSYVVAVLNVNTDGTVSVYKDAGAGVFTTSGAKGIGAVSISYTLL